MGSMAGRPPVFLAVAERIRNQLAAGAWSEGLPPERSLASALGVSRATLRKAMAELHRESPAQTQAPARRGTWPRVLYLGQRLGDVHADITAGLIAHGTAHGMRIELPDLPPPPWNPAQAKMVRAAATGCRAVVAFGREMKAIEQLDLPAETALVAYDFHHPGRIRPGWSVVVVDRLRGLVEAVEHLWQRGHRHIGLVGGGDPDPAHPLSLIHI
jgi:hypothetical protein